ncbi:MAG: MATE family efflux transporter [Oscillospiraceae bacterium]|nr:MATE family efflux transporter [Oscillospiraceae bacterium]
MKHKKRSAMAMDLANGPVSKTLIIFAIPLAAANLLQIVSSIVSMVVMGQFVGSAGLTAVTIGSEITQTLTFMAMGLSNAGQIIISQFMGAGDRASVSRTIGTMFTVIMLSSLVLTAVCVIGVNTFLTLLNTPYEAFQMAREFVLICSAGLFFIFGYNLVSAILRGMGDSRRPLMFISIASISNLILALIFVSGLGLEAIGAALATVIGQAISFITSIIFLYRKRAAFGFDFKPKSFKVDNFILKRLLRLGIPMCIQSAAINFSMMYVNSFINAYGVIATAVTGIGSRIGFIMNVVCGSLSAAGSSMIGQSLGARKIERVPVVIRFSLIVNLIFASILSAFIVLIPRQMFGIFNSDVEVLDMAMLYVIPAVLNNYGFALRAPLFALINGVGYAKLNLLVGLLDGVICRISLALLLGIVLGMGVSGFWYGSVLAGYVPFLIGGTYFISGKWKTRKLLISR